MEALQIESQTDQTPFARRRQFPAQGELAEAEYLLDDADHRFDGAFARAVDGFAQRRPELVGHLHLGTRLFGRRVGQRRKTLVPAGMMGISARGDVRLDAALLTRRQGRGARIPSIECCRLWYANDRGNGIERGFSLLAVVGMIGEGPSDDEQTLLIDGHLCVVILLKSGIRRVFHDARLWIGEVVLIAGTGPWHRRGRRATTRFAPGRALPLRALRQLGLILLLLGGQPLGGTRL